MDVNVRGTFLTCRALLPAMQDAGSGCIVNIASTAGLSGGHTRAAYNASKGAVVLFTRSLAIDWGPRGVRVNCVCPGLIDTPMADWIRLDAVRLAAFERSLPAQRIGTPEDVADAVVVPGLGRRVVPARQYAGRRWRGHRLSTIAAAKASSRACTTSSSSCAWAARSGRARSRAGCGARGRSSGDRVEVRELPDRSRARRGRPAAPRHPPARRVPQRGEDRRRQRRRARDRRGGRGSPAPHGTDRPLPRGRLARRDRGDARADEGRPALRRGRGRARARDLRRARPSRDRALAAHGRGPRRAARSAGRPRRRARRVTPASARRRSRTRSRVARTRRARSIP